MDSLINFSTILVDNQSSSTPLPLKDTMYIREMDRMLWIYWSPFTFVLGLSGNILVIKIFCFSKEKNITTNTTAIYFTVMAIADLGFLISGIVPEWLEACGFVVFKELHFVTCKLEKFVFYTTGDVAIWIICVNTMDRFIAVCFPFTQQRFRKAIYAKICSFITLLVAIVKNFHVFWTRGLVYTDSGDFKNCGRPEPYENFELYVRPWIAIVTVVIIPFCLLSVFNIFIVRFLIKEQNRARTTGRKHKPDFTQTIIMCVAVSLAFLVFVTPSLIIYIGRPYWDTDNSNYDIAKAVSNQLSYVNHAINFLLYCITAKKFRDEAVRVLCFPKIAEALLKDNKELKINKCELTRIGTFQKSLKFSENGKSKLSSDSKTTILNQTISESPLDNSLQAGTSKDQQPVDLNCCELSDSGSLAENLEREMMVPCRGLDQKGADNDASLAKINLQITSVEQHQLNKRY